MLITLVPEISSLRTHDQQEILTKLYICSLPTKTWPLRHIFVLWSYLCFAPNTNTSTQALASNTNTPQALEQTLQEKSLKILHYALVHLEGAGARPSLAIASLQCIATIASKLRILYSIQSPWECTRSSLRQSKI